jgi:hypothetical protein
MDPEALLKMLDKRFTALETSIKFDIERQRTIIFKNKKQLEAAILTNKLALERTSRRQGLGWALHLTALAVIAWLAISLSTMRGEMIGLQKQVSFLENTASFLMGKNQRDAKAKPRR